VSNDDALAELLNAYWLRPETALWRAIDIRAMRSFQFRSPSLDLGCGDGLFSFIRAGGRLDPAFDAFQATTALDQFFSNADVYDAFDESVHPQVTRRPEYRIDCAFDHKPNLLKKAAGLGLYQRLQTGDANKKLPFADASFSSMFSNIVYWLDDPSAAISEIARVLTPSGTACLMLPNSTLPEFSFYHQLFVRTGDRRWAFLDKLDRGRFSDNIRQAKSAGEWEAIFRKAGLSVETHVRHLSKTVIQIWDVGLRPLFPELVRMSRAMPKDDLQRLKRDWVSTLHEFVAPLTEMDGELQQGEEPAFHCYIVMKKTRT
jgi:SAM-dependent methyltransferase